MLDLGEEWRLAVAGMASKKVREFKSPGEIGADLLVFALGLLFAWRSGWTTTELVWSLWLSSLIVGGATILLVIGWAVARGPGPGWELERWAFLDRWWKRAPLAVGFLLFFAVHFGLFHLVHGVFLWSFFPLNEALLEAGDVEGLAREFLGLLPFVGMFAWAERRGVARSMRRMEMVGPYKNVVRLHVLIFFFAGAAALGLPAFAVFAVVYALFFAPVRRRTEEEEGSGGQRSHA